MKKIKLLLVIIFVITLATIWAYVVVKRQRQADLNLLSNVAQGFFERDYSSFVLSEKGAITVFPIKRYYQDFERRRIDVNFTEKGSIIYLLNMPLESYLRLQMAYMSSGVQEPRVLPLMWAERKCFGMSYWVYWGGNGNGYMTISEYEGFVSRISNGNFEGSRPELH